MSPAVVLVKSSWPWMPTLGARRDGDTIAGSCLGSGELTVSADARVPAEQAASETSAADTVTTVGVRVTHRRAYLMLLLPFSCRCSELRPGRLKISPGSGERPVRRGRGGDSRGVVQARR